MLKAADVEVTNEEIIIHPVALFKRGKWEVEFRVIGDVIIEGEKYTFNTVLQTRIEKDLGEN